MSVDGVDSGAPNLNLTTEEKRLYGQLFRQADTDGVGVVTGEIAVKFFEKTRLDSRILGEIWQIADKENRGFLTPSGFGIVLRLIGHAQGGREPTAELALQPGPLPRFDGIFPNMGSPPATPIALQAQSSGGGAVRVPPLTADKAVQYAGLFDRQNLQGSNLLPGELARQIFDKSGLPNEVLGKIWELSDTEQRGALVQTEFIIAMHLLTCMRTGALRSLPNVLPAALYEAATHRGTAPRQSPSGTGTGISAIPRQMSGSQHQPRSGSPLGRPPIGHQGTGASDWTVSPSDKQKFDQIYVTLDKGNKGFITGEEAVPFFSQSNLSEDNLAQIWDLADFNSQGTLTREGFAVAMHLIKEQRSGRMATLPQTLPDNLKPPSARTQARQAPAAPTFEPPPMQKPPPPQPKSALDDLFGLDSSVSSPAPAPLQNPMSTGGSNANDPFAGGSSSIPPSSPTRPATTNNNSSFKPFIPSSSFGRGLTQQGTGDSNQATRQAPASDDLLSDNDEAKKVTGESTELAHLSNQIGTLSKQMQETQAKRTSTQNEINQANSQKTNFEQRLAQLRTAYEKEAKDTQALEEQLRESRKETAKLQGECMTLEGQLRDSQQQHQQVQAALQADQKENANLRERIRVTNGEIAQLKPHIEKLKSDARQQKGLVAINKKQLSTTEGERDKLKTEAEDISKKSPEDASKDLTAGSPPQSTAQIASPALSSASGSNPFFRRTGSTDIMGAVASPPARNYQDRSFDDVFGPTSTQVTPPAPAIAFKQQNTGDSSNYSTPPASSPVVSRQATLHEPPAPPESRQMSSSFLPFPDPPVESLSSSRQVSPPASRAEGSITDAPSPFPGDASTETGSNIPGAFPVGGDEIDEKPAAATEAAKVEDRTLDVAGSDPFSNSDDSKAKADFDNAFAAFTSSKKPSNDASAESAKPKPAVDSEFPPISEVEQDDDSDSASEEGGFDDDFAPVLPEVKKSKEAKPQAPNGEPAAPPPVPEKAKPADSEIKSSEVPSSPATITNEVPKEKPKPAPGSFFGSAPPGESKTTAPAPPTKTAFDDLDDDFEGLEDAKEGSADDDFANISRSGLDDFNPVFDSSPPGSQAKSESTAFGNESGFDFITHNSAAAPAAPAKPVESHDWDAIFSGLDEPASAEASQLHMPAAPAPAPAAEASKTLNARPAAGRALTETGEHDDPILKNLTGMGYSRADALSALEKYDYNLERAANFLASQS